MFNSCAINNFLRSSVIVSSDKEETIELVILIVEMGNFNRFGTHAGGKHHI